MNINDFHQSVEGIVEVIKWNDDGSAIIRCPGEHLHHGQGSPAMFWPDPPHISCFHQSCRSAVQCANYELAMTECDEPSDREPTQQQIEQRKWSKRLRKVRHLARMRVLPSLPSIPIEEWCRRSPVPVEHVPADEQFRLFLAALYPQQPIERWDRAEPLIWTGEINESGPACTLNFRTVHEWIKRGRPYGQQISVFSFKRDVLTNGLRRKKFTDKRLFLVLESDTLSLQEFGGVIEWMQKMSALRAIVLTGGKSAHAYFDPPEFPWPKWPDGLRVIWQDRQVSIDEIMVDRMHLIPGFDEAYDRAVRERDADEKRFNQEVRAWSQKIEELIAILQGLGCDKQMLRSNLTARCPGVERRDDEGNPTGRFQRLIYLNPRYASP